MCHNSTKYLLHKENLTNVVVLVYTYMKMCYIVFTGLNLYGNLLNWLYHGLNLLENLQNLAAPSGAQPGFF